MSEKLLRGSPKYQAKVLFELVRRFGESKNAAKYRFYAEAVNKFGISKSSANCAERIGVYGHKTGHEYIRLWAECIKYVRDIFTFRSADLLSTKTIQTFLEHKICQTQNYNTLGVIFASMVKIGAALDIRHGKDINNPERLSDIRAGVPVRSEFRTYVDDVRAAVAGAKAFAKENGLKLYRPVQARAYQNPQAVRDNLTDEKHILAADLIDALGTRISECSLIRPYQLSEKNTLSYISKGGQGNLRTVPSELADRLRGYFKTDGEFRVNKNQFRNDVKEAARVSEQKYNQVHGLRWNYAQESYAGLRESGMSHEEALKEVAEQMSHHRSTTTLHYLQKG